MEQIRVTTQRTGRPSYAGYITKKHLVSSTNIRKRGPEVRHCHELQLVSVLLSGTTTISSENEDDVRWPVATGSELPPPPLNLKQASPEIACGQGEERRHGQ